MGHERRFLRFNDQFRTMTVQLPSDSYAETRACLHAHARQIPSDSESHGTSGCVTPSWG